MFGNLMLTECELRLIHKVAVDKSVTSVTAPQKYRTRIGNAITADYWKGIADKIESALGCEGKGE